MVLLIGAGLAAGGVVAAQTIVGNMIMAAAPPERAGSASALNETAGEFGSSMGMALLGSMGAAIYHHKMADVAVGGLPADALHASHETVGSAAAVAAQLHNQAGTVLLTTARDAYSSGLHFAAGGGAVVLLLTAVFAFQALRNEPVPAPAPKKEKKQKKGAEPVAVESEVAPA
jgi:DHA2 family multidrug resistance protein-like MFS transporter